MFFVFAFFKVSAYAVTFTPRLTAPSASDYHYTSDNPFYNSGFGMPNCTCYAWGRAYEILGSKPNLSTGNANTFYAVNQSRGAYAYGSTPKLGAIACWSGGSGSPGHVAVVEKIEGNKITISESHYQKTNFNTKVITAGRESSYISGFQGYIYILDDATIGNNPEGSCDLINGNTGSITIDGWVIDKDNKSASLELHVYIGGPAGEGEGHPGIIANKYRPDVPISLEDAALGDYHGFKDTIPTKKTGNQDVYVYAINVGSGENILLKKQTVYIEPDVTNPSITEDKVSDITDDGYTITCKVTDNVNVSRVVFCTWTEENGQDDIVEENGTASGDIYTYRVSRAAHNNEFGNYITHIYAYDYSGNYVGIPIGAINMGYCPEGFCEAINGNIGSVTIDGWTLDKDIKEEALQLHVYIGGPAGSGEGHPGIIADQYRPDVPEALEDDTLGEYHGFKDTIYTKKTGNQDVYVYAINVGKGDNTLLAKETVYIEPDSTKPSISNIKISDVTSDGYTITCDAEDNVTVKRVVFSTWTDSNGQDDKVEEDGTKSGNTYTYRVKRSSHNNECGDYTTHIFAYDYTGNYALASAGTTDIGHIEVTDKGTAATCETAGKTEGKHCSACGKVLKEQEVIPAKGHTEVIDEAIAATCESVGKTEGKHCSVCDKVLVEQKVIPAKGHTEVIDEAIEATCESAGKTEGKHCFVCGKVLVEQEVISAKGHIEVADKAVEATCETAGKTEGKHCSACGKILEEQEVVPAKGHTEVIDKAVAATCETAGKTAGSHCSACGKVLEKQEIIPAKGHTEVIDKAVAATCETAGKTEGKHCSACGKVLEEQKVISAKDHTEVIDKAIEATCEAAGKTAGIHCSACGKVLEEQEIIPAKGHDYTEKIEKSATQYEEGLIKYTCENCGDCYYETIDKLQPSKDDGKETQSGTVTDVDGSKTKNEPQGTAKDEEKKAAKNVTTGTVLRESKSGGVYKVIAADGGNREVQYIKPMSGQSTVVIPNTIVIDGVSYKVTEICANAFANDTTLRKVVIGDSVKKIGANAFANCKRLQSVTFGNNVSVIENKAFYKCVSLKKITIPSQIVKIGKKAFFGAKKLKNIVIKTKKLAMKNVGSKAFKGINAKAKIKVPKAKRKAYGKMLRKKGVSGRAIIK